MENTDKYHAAADDYITRQELQSISASMKGKTVASWWEIRRDFRAEERSEYKNTNSTEKTKI